MASRLPRRSWLLAFVASVAVAASLLVWTPAEAANGRTQRLASADRFHGAGLTAFNSYATRARRGEVPTHGLDWSHDGCTAPSSAVAKVWRDFFRRGCVRHDFGYRNYGRGINASPSRALASTNAQKKVVDRALLADLRWLCRHRKRPVVTDPASGIRKRATLRQCDTTARTMYLGVRRSFGGSLAAWYDSQTAWHGGECTPGALCLYVDRGYKDHRVTFGSKSGHPADSRATSVASLAAHRIDDRASAVWNRSPYAWRLYAGQDHTGRSVCVPAGAKVPQLKSAPHRFNDRASSLKRLKSSRC